MTDETVDGGTTPAAPTAKKLIVRNPIDATQLRKDISYGLANLGDAQIQQASLFLHYSSLHAQTERQVDDIELMLEAAESRVYRKLRDAAVTAGEKITEELLKRSVIDTPTIRKIKMALNEAKQIAAVAKGAVEAFRQRRDMLIQTGASEREQMKGELRTLGRAASDARANEAGNRVAAMFGAQNAN